LGGYTFDGVENLETRPISGLRVGYDFTKHWGVEGVFEYMRSKYSDANVIQAFPEVFGYRLEGLYHFMPQSRLVPYLAVGIGGRSIRFKDLPFDRNNVDVDYGVGLKYFLYDNLALRGDVRHVVLLNDNLNNLEYTLGISYYFGGPKPAPPAKAKPGLRAPINLAARAASQSQIDLDWNSVDGASGYKIYRDGSYLTSSQTVAVSDAELRPNTRYCYMVTAVDDEGRESVQSNEACATTPAPEPRVEEKVVIMASEPKVEEKVMVAAAEPKIIILAFEDVHFDFDKSTLKPEAQTILKRNIQMLKDNPNAKVRIAGYTSASGTEAYNQRLSERRAKAVEEYLINEGLITRDRLSTIGYGETNPAMYEAAPKELYSVAAKANMRVLFEIIVK
jgi:outer membrane beta-barrel protein